MGSDGWPHLMPLWYVVRDGECWGWTYGKSQKVRNLERDSRCTLQVEAGDSYHELRGVMIKAACAIYREPASSPRSATGFPRATATVTRRPAVAAKRVALQFVSFERGLVRPPQASRVSHRRAARQRTAPR